MKNYIETIIMMVFFFTLLIGNTTTNDVDIEKVTLLGMSIIFVGVCVINIIQQNALVYIKNAIDEELEKELKKFKEFSVNHIEFEDKNAPRGNEVN